MSLKDSERIGYIEFRTHCAEGEGNRAEMVTDPPPALSAISLEMLDQLASVWRDPDDPDVLVFAPHARYRLGAVIEPRRRLLHLITDGQQP